MKVIIAGSRSFANYKLLAAKLDILFSINKPSLIISGGANGADKFGEIYAIREGYPVQRYLPDWKTYGKSAGMKRNCSMAQNADALVAFWDGVSHGTKQMIDYATKKGLKVRVVRY